MTPSLSEAVAVSTIEFPVVKIELFEGLVRLTVGRTLGATMMMEAIDDDVVAPTLSVALAVNIKTPSGTLFHVKLKGLEVICPRTVVPL